jgi:MoaA/NifB/PqqE/SkfB family radical SAM enzyme
MLLVSPTQRCNLVCQGCYAASTTETKGTLSYATFRRILQDKRDNWGSHFTVLSGGEPLLYRSEGKTIYDIFQEFPDNYFQMYTNGTLIDDAAAARLAALGNVLPAISVEGFEAETDTRRGKGVFGKTERAMRALREAGVPFGISLTATKANADTLMSDALIDHYFGELGAILGWVFHYMPIGRSVDPDLMVSPEQRKRLLDRQIDLLMNRDLFFVDFWNGGPMSAGCISAGRPGGYFNIDWNGDIQPCVFVPFAVDNIYKVYESGRELTSVLDNPLFVDWRRWQREYQGNGGLTPTQNLFMPCPMRDHFDVASTLLTRHKIRPANTEAAEAIKSATYKTSMLEYDRQLSELLDPIWSDRMGGSQPQKRQPKAVNGEALGQRVHHTGQ